MVDFQNDQFIMLFCKDQFLLKRLCAILGSVEKDCEIWQIWAQTLQHWGIAGWTAALLDAAGPLTLLGAQAVYLGQPLLGRAVSNDRLEALVRVLEDTRQTRAFARFLREESSL